MDNRRVKFLFKNSQLFRKNYQKTSGGKIFWRTLYSLSICVMFSFTFLYLKLAKMVYYHLFYVK